MTTTTATSDEMLKAPEVSAMTGVPVSTLHSWAAKRDKGQDAPGPAHHYLSPRHRRWRRRDVDAWLSTAQV